MLQAAEIIKLFRHKAERARATVKEVVDVKAALAHTVKLFRHNAAGISMPRDPKSGLPVGEWAVPHMDAGLIATPDLSTRHFSILRTYCERAGIPIVSKGLRNHCDNIQIGLTWARFGIAETGSLVIGSTDEDLRLATMVSEIHVAMLPVTGIYESATDLASQMRSTMRKSENCLDLLSGTGIKADLDPASAAGVYGPQKLYILLIGEDHAQA